MDAFKKAGFEARVTERVQDFIWGKLIVNAGINALTAITRLNNGRLIEYPGTHQILKNAVIEAVHVAREKGIRIIYDDPVKKVEDTCRLTSGNVSSMLQDILGKRRTEIDYINGAIVSEGEKLGIRATTNELLTNLVKTIEESYDKQVHQI
jgi:2-dehydropantoate 2-reductase